MAEEMGQDEKVCREWGVRGVRGVVGSLQEGESEG